MHKRVTFAGFGFPLALLAPQLLITLIFFIWPAAQALYQSVLRQDAFGLRTTFVGLQNFQRLFADPLYLSSFQVTTVFSVAVTFSGLAIALLLASMADRVIKGASGYKTLLILPYAVAPAIAGVLWWFMFNPSIGIFRLYGAGAGL